MLVMTSQEYREICTYVRTYKSEVALEPETGQANCSSQSIPKKECTKILE